MNDRRRFLHVLGVTSAAVALPACGGDTTAGAGTTGAGGGAGGGSSTTGGGGAGGTGASTGETSSATASSSVSTGTGGNCEMNPVGTDVGIPDDFGTDGLHLVPKTKILIGRDASGLYALTSVCSHEFCDMNAVLPSDPSKPGGTTTAEGINCNCHNSKFDSNGVVMKGPAIKPLKAYAMVLGCDGKLYVDSTKVVPNTQRLDV